ADDRLRAFGHGLRHGHGHAAILERGGRIEPLELDVQLAVETDVARYVVQSDQRRIALAQTDGRGVVRQWQARAVTLDQTRVTLAHDVVPSILEFGHAQVHDAVATIRQRFDLGQRLAQQALADRLGLNDDGSVIAVPVRVLLQNGFDANLQLRQQAR